MEHETAGVPAGELPADLAARIAAGDAVAEQRLVEIYGRGVAIILDRHAAGRAEAEDLYQDTFRIALEKLRGGELREPEKLPAFVAQIARNLALEHYRKTSRRRTDTDSETVQAVATVSAGQLGELLARENAALVRRAIDDLDSARDREILLRFYIAEEDKESISEAFGLSSLQFNRVLHRARQRYKALFMARFGAARGGGGEPPAAAPDGIMTLLLALLLRNVAPRALAWL